MRTENCDAIVIGAGAAGLMTALTAGQKGVRVAIIDHNEQPGRKILISGGGRCNFTHMDTTADHFKSANQRFAKSALSRYRPQDFVAMVNRHKIAWHEKTPGQLFCSGSANEILEMLLAECEAAHVALHTGETITDVTHNTGFRVTTAHRILEAPNLVIATGGLSIPKIGASSFAFDLARYFNIPVIPTAPGLVPLRFDGEDYEWIRSLAGTSLVVEAKSGRKSFTDSMIFTHRGLSGPAMLQISSWLSPDAPLQLNLLPKRSAFDALREARKQRPKAGGAAILNGLLPERLARTLAPSLFGTTEAANWSDRILRAADTALHQMQITPTDTEGYIKAEVTTGGIDTKALSSRSMEVNAIPGLHIVGEAVDVTGWLGGFNFQWAWASGHAAGTAIAEKKS